MKRVVMIAGPVQAVPPQKGAAVEWWMLQVCRQFAHGDAIEPHLIAIAAPGQALHEVIDGVQVHRIRFGRLYRRVFQKLTRLDPFSFAHRATQLARRIKPDIIHVHNAPELAGELRCRFPTRPVIFHAHNEFAANRVARGMALFTVSHSLARTYQMLGFAVSAVIPNGVDIAASRAAAPAALPIADQALRSIVLYAGRVSPEKGLLHLALALPHVVRAHPQALLVIAGEARASRAGRDDARALYTSEVQAALAACPAHHLWLGSIAPEAMPAIYKSAALAVVPSVFSEPFGMVALEAMAAGVCVLVAPRGGLPEFVVDGETGCHIKLPHADDADGSHLAQQITQLLNPLSPRAELATNAAHAAQAYDWQTVANVVRAAYDKLASPR